MSAIFFENSFMFFSSTVPFTPHVLQVTILSCRSRTACRHDVQAVCSQEDIIRGTISRESFAPHREHICSILLLNQFPPIYPTPRRITYTMLIILLLHALHAYTTTFDCSSDLLLIPYSDVRTLPVTATFILSVALSANHNDILPKVYNHCNNYTINSSLDYSSFANSGNSQASLQALFSFSNLHTYSISGRCPLLIALQRISRLSHPQFFSSNNALFSAVCSPISVQVTTQSSLPCFNGNPTNNQCICSQGYFGPSCSFRSQILSFSPSLYRIEPLTRNYHHYIASADTTVIIHANRSVIYAVQHNSDGSPNSIVPASVYNAQRSAIGKVFLEKGDVLLVTAPNNSPEQQEYTIALETERPFISILMVSVIVGTSIFLMGVTVFFVFECVLKKRNRVSHSPTDCPTFYEIPTMSYQIYSKIVSNLDASDCCAICLQQYMSSSIVTITYCSHVLHAECLERWNEKDLSCPICRKDLSFVEVARNMEQIVREANEHTLKTMNDQELLQAICQYRGENRRNEHHEQLTQHCIH